MNMCCFVGALALLTATTAFAQNTAQSQSAAPAQADMAEKKICRTERMTGSLTRSTRTCMTRAQWARLSEVTEKNVDGLLKDSDRSSAVPCAPGYGCPR